MATPVTIDIHHEITNRIVAAVETAGAVRLPWIRDRGGSFGRPVNVASGKAYNGVNVLALWIAAITADFPTNLWGTYRQWREAGAQVRRGEKSSPIVFYKTYEIGQPVADGTEAEREQRFVARASHVFNAAQVDGFDLETAVLPDKALFDPIARAERFVQASGAQIEERGDVACYVPALDLIRMPERRRFVGTATATPAEGFYATLCHELTHWTGAKGRLERDLSIRFGSDAYALEELVAELGAAFLSADLGLTLSPRDDHARYIAHWLKVMKADPRAIFTAAAKASQAANWLMAFDRLDAS